MLHACFKHRLLEWQAPGHTVVGRANFKRFLNRQVKKFKKSHHLMTKSEPDPQRDPWEPILGGTFLVLSKNELFEK